MTYEDCHLQCMGLRDRVKRSRILFSVRECALVVRIVSGSLNLPTIILEVLFCGGMDVCN